MNRLRRFVSSRWRCVVACVAVMMSAAAPSEAFPTGDAGVLEDIENSQAPFMVRVDVDRRDASYAIGDEIRVTVRSERDGYLYLLYIDANENVCCIFPNRVQRSNMIKAGEDVMTPAADSGFRLRVSPPTGTESLKALVTSKPLESMQHERLVAGDKTVLSSRDLQAIKGESSARADWAEDDVTITTVASRPSARPVRRHALVIGAATHADALFPSRPASHGDARELAAALRESCRFDTVEMLVDSAATREKIRKALTISLRNATAPGDTVLLAWSGPIARLPDDDGDEAGGCDTVFLPHDAHGAEASGLRGSGITDDDLCDWLRDLDGRIVLIVLDGCDEAKLPPGVAFDAEVAVGPLDREVHRMCELGRQRLAVAASSHPGQTPLVRPGGGMSEMTGLFVDRLRAGTRPLTLTAVFADVLPALTSLARARQSSVTPSLVGTAGDAELVSGVVPLPGDRAAVPQGVTPVAPGGVKP